MLFPKTGSCPFPGGHWPSKWGEEKITAKSFSCLNSDQKQDLIEYIGEHDLAKTSATSQPAYRFPLFKLQKFEIQACLHRARGVRDVSWVDGSVPFWGAIPVFLWYGADPAGLVALAPALVHWEPAGASRGRCR